MTTGPQHEDLLERARNVIRDLKEKLARAEARTAPDSVAIVGMAGRFPGSGEDLNAFWKMISEGGDAVRDIPPERWDNNAFYNAKAPAPGKTNMRRAAFLDEVARFDAAFFDVTPVEAVRMDPQQRIFLETAWHALEDAGMTRAELRGSDAGVFVGVHGHSADYGAMQFDDPATLDGYAATGTAHDVIAGRLAYWLDLRGPSMVIDTACSSSLVAVHLACRSLRAGDCSLAVVGGTNLILSPRTSVAMSQLQMLADDGRSKTFDSRADGFGRGEGCGVVVLKRLSDALRDQDRVLAVIRGSAINQDGRTNGLTAPSGLAQQRLIERALKEAGVSPAEIGYFEAHGTGTALGDPIEVEAIAEVMGKEERSTPCVLGSVKANIGHLEGAAGIAGLIKTVLVMQHGYLPPVAHLEELNPHLVLDGSRLTIPKRGEPWARHGRRFSSISSFGWSGTNAHVVLEEAPEQPAAASAPNLPVLVAVSAETQEALHVLGEAYAERVASVTRQELADIGHTSTARRTHHRYRVAAVASDGPAMAAALRTKAGHATKLSVNSQQRDERPLVDAAADPAGHLHQLASEYERGAEIAWKEIFPDIRNTVSLPQYPFQGRQYWLASNVLSVRPQNAGKAPDDWFYEVEWTKRPLEAGEGQRNRRAVWLLVGDSSGFVHTLAEMIRQRGDGALVVTSGPEHQRTSQDLYILNGTIERGADDLFRKLAREDIHPGYVVMVADKRGAAASTKDALALAQNVIRSNADLKLWFVTQGAQAIDTSSAPGAWEQSALWGFARGFGLEHPRLAGGVIDVDRANEADAEQVVGEIVRDSVEDRVVLRNGARFVPRLRRVAPMSGSQTLKLRADGCYLVTGAFGGIGFDIAEWLADHGAQNLVLTGRRKPEEMQNPRLMERLQALRSRGVMVRAESCDVSDETQLRSLFNEIAQNGLPLRGLVHAAAAMLFASVSETSSKDVELAFRAKVEGASLLDRLSRGCGLDFFVMFSSAAVSVGSRNASLYAAANSCLNTLAADRKAAGLAALSVEWGLWEPTADHEQRELIARSGFIPMPSGRALDALGRLMVSGVGHGVVAAIDWAVLGPALTVQGKDAFVTELVNHRAPEQKAGEQKDEAAWLSELKRLAPKDRVERLLMLVSVEAKSVFGMPQDEPLDDQRGLADMGMDSLMTVTLQNRLQFLLGVTLSSTLVLDYPTLTALAAFLDEKLFGKADALPQAESLPDEEPGLDEAEMASIVGMSDAEMDRALEVELAAIRKLGVH